MFFYKFPIVLHCFVQICNINVFFKGFVLYAKFNKNSYKIISKIKQNLKIPKKNI